MPFGKWASFEDCVQDMMKTQNYDEETAKKVCGKLKAQLGKESFSWVGDIKPFGKLIRGKALHPLKTTHPEEWPNIRVYLEEELQKSAHTLAGKPLLIDHTRPLRGEVLGAEYKNGAIEYIAKLEDQNALNKIRNGKIRHCSVEFEWKSLENVDGVAPRGINFTALSLLEKFRPGDPLSSVEVWEAIVKRLKEAKNVRRDVHMREQAEPQEFILYQIHDSAAFLEERFSTSWIDQTNGIQGIFGRPRENPENPQPMALLFMKANGWTIEKMQEWLRDHPQYRLQIQPQPAPAAIGIQPAQPGPSQTQGVVMKMGKNPIWERVWTRNYINNLPDSAFAIILPGGEKDETGKTVPRTLRKFPHHRADGSIDLPHLRNANARASQSDLTEEQKEKAMHHLARHKKAAGIGVATEEAKLLEQEPGEVREVEFEIAPEPTMDELIESIENAIKEINEAFDALVSRVEELEKWQKESPTYKVQAQEQQGNQLPEKDEHGCIVGKERWDPDQEKCVPIGENQESKKRPLGEAIIEPGVTCEPGNLVSKQEVLALIPDKRVWRSWSLGPQRLVQDLKRILQSSQDGSSRGRTR